jgi:cytochrome P450
VFIEFFAYTETEIKKTMATYDPESEPTNFIHAFMKAAADKKVGTFSDKQLLATSIDIFGAGADTTATTLRWAIFFLAHHQDIQEKMYQEIKEQVGTHTLPNYGDRLKLPLTEAVIMETQRASNLLPIGMPRKALESTKMMGYDIPKDAIILILMSNIMHNEKLYPDHAKFDPRRFLDANGKVIRDPKLIPFQLGKTLKFKKRIFYLNFF